MSFSYASGVITQTGTDTDLSGLSGLTGVTVTTTGSRTVYSIDSSTRIIFDGTCTIDPRVNELETNRLGGGGVVVNGTLNLGLELTYNYGSQYTSGRALNILGGSDVPWGAIFDVNGTLNWYGCEVETGSGIAVYNGGTIKIRDGVFISRLGNHTIQQGNTIIFQTGSTADIIGLKKTLTGSLTADNSAINILGAFTTTNLSGIVSTGSISPDNRSSTLAPMPFAVVSNWQRLQDRVANILTNLSHFIDCASWDTTSPVAVNRRTGFGTVTRHGQAEFYRNCNGKILFNGSGLQGVKLYWKDIDNGNRGVTLATEWGQTYNTYREYNATTDANGDFTSQVLEAAFYVTTDIAFQAPPVDDRTESGHKITFSGYKYGYSAFTIQFQGNRIVAAEATQPVIADANITESNKATVDAYTEIDTSAKFYDRAASHLEDNLGTYLDFIVTRSGNAINAGSYDVVIDATASPVFDLTGNVITIHADIFTGDITTTGSITFQNGAQGVGVFTSSSGTQTSISLTFNNLSTSTVEIFDNTGSSVQRYTNQTGTLVYITPLGSTGTWSYIIDRIGYRPIIASFDPTLNNLIIDATQELLLTAQGNAMYSGSSSNLVNISYDFVTPQLNIEIGDGGVSPQVIFDEVEQSLVTANGMRWQKENATLVTFDDLPAVGQVLFMQDNIRLKRASAGDVNAAVNGYVLSTQGTPVDGVNGNVSYIASPDYATPIWDALLANHDVSSSFGALLQLLETKTQADSRQATLVGEHNDTQADIAALNDFNPATDTVANVTLVATTTTNTDMRGTDGANTIAPDNAGITQIQTDISNLNDITAAEVYTEFTTGTNEDAFKADVSNLASQASVDTLQTSVNAIPTTDSVADLTPVLTAISSLNDPTPAEIRAAFNAADFKDKNTEAEIHTWLDSYLNKDDWKDGSVDLQPVIDLINGLNDFDPATDVVARVTLVDTTTTNTDMRGTDGANTTAPDNTAITAIKERTDNLPDDPASNSKVEEAAFL